LLNSSPLLENFLLYCSPFVTYPPSPKKFISPSYKSILAILLKSFGHKHSKRALDIFGKDFALTKAEKAENY
jgi:hypothetical protein